MSLNVVDAPDAVARTEETLVSVLAFRAREAPQQVGYVYVPGDGQDATELTYGELATRARQVAAQLQGLCEPGERVLLLYPPGLDFLYAFLGCLFAGVVGIPLFPPRPNRTLSRLEGVIGDSKARLALMLERTRDDLHERWAEHDELGKVQCVTTDATALPPAAAAGPDRLPQPADLAYLQYTSGSTSAPKGVMITHQNLTYNCRYMREAYGLNTETVSVTWLPHFHDMGLIEGLLNPLYVGYRAIVVPPPQFVQQPLLWLQTITRFKATHSGAPNFAFDLCVRKVRPDQLGELELGSWRTAYSGAEPVRSETMDRFSRYFASAGFRRDAFYPCYGLAEATLMVTGGDPERDPVVRQLDATALEQGRVEAASDAGRDKARAVVGCGRAFGQTRLAIVDPTTQRRCPPDRIGEIWVGGPTRAAGYWQKPEDTQATFQAKLADSPSDENHSSPPYLRTGDLGFVSDGELFITGRLKDLIILHGINLYPQDIEWAVERAHRALRPGCSAAFAIEADGDEQLVVVAELDRSFRKAGEEEFEAIARAVRQAVYEEFDQELHSLQLLKVGSIHKTSSGKIQRQACRADFLRGELAVVWESRHERSPSSVPRAGSSHPPSLEELALLDARRRERAMGRILRSQVARVLDLDERQIDPRLPLGSYGLNSLKGQELLSRLQEQLGISIPATAVWNYPSLGALQTFLSEQFHATRLAPPSARTMDPSSSDAFSPDVEAT